jgi:predicted ArsR family transcriptional regulator
MRSVDTTDRALEQLAALAEPVRRRLYQYVASRPAAVGRDEAAGAVGVSRALAAFHLDRLVEDGLLIAEYRRLTGRTGPGAGRPAKLYRPAAAEVEISLPPRDYRLAAGVFADALEGGEVTEAAHARGETIGRAAHDERTASGESGSIEEVLVRAGYQPFRDETGDIRLANCPFHELAATHRGLTCGMNLALLEGVLEGLGAEGIQARLDPQPGRCCVVLHETVAV